MDWRRRLNLQLLHLITQVHKLGCRRLWIVELGSAVRRGRNESLVELWRQRLDRAPDVLLMLLLVILLLRLRKVKALILRIRKVGGCSGLEWTAEEELRRKQGSELHVECSARGLQIIVVVLLGHCLCIYRRNVCPARMPIPIPTHRHLVRIVRPMREACFTARGFGSVSGEPSSRRPVRGVYLCLLHPEKMRRQDKAVPRERW